MDAKTKLKDQAAEPARHRRPRARAASLLLLRHGSDHGADPPAVRRRRHLLERGRALQHRADAPGAGGQEGRRRRRRHAARVLHHHRHRRHRHGPRGHEVLAAVARGHRRFGRADHARPLLRRAGRPRRLRQVAARHDDGDVPAQRAVDLHLWRLDPARHLQGPAGHRAGRVRGGRQAFGRQDVGRRSRRARAGRPVRRPAPAAASSPPTPWPPSPRRSAWRCRIRPARRRPTRSATASAWPPARRSWT